MSKTLEEALIAKKSAESVSSAGSGKSPMAHASTFSMGVDSNASVTKDSRPMKRLQDGDESPYLQKRNKLAVMKTMKTFAIGMQQEDYDEKWLVSDNNDEMPLSGLIINMGSDLMPAGLLPLAQGMAASGVGWIPSAILVVIFMILSSNMLIMVGKIASHEDTKAKGVILTFQSMWEITVGKYAWVPPLMVVLVCFGNCIAYSCFFAALLNGALPGFHIPGLGPSDTGSLSRTIVLLVISGTLLLKLCMLRDLSSLAPSSAAGIFFVIYTTVFMAVRAFDGSYAVGGLLYDTEPTPLPATMTQETMWAFPLSMQPFFLINDLALGYLSHYNGMKYFRELENHSVSRFAIGVRTAMGVSAVVYICIMYLGYMTFGANSQSVILDNYHNADDIPATIARVGMGLSIVFSYPLMFAGLREAFVATLKTVKPEKGDLFDTISFQNMLTMGTLGGITVIAILCEDPSLVIGIVGSLLGSSIIYLLPAFLFIMAHKDLPGFKLQIFGAICLFVIGVFLAVLGCYDTIAG